MVQGEMERTQKQAPTESPMADPCRCGKAVPVETLASTQAVLGSWLCDLGAECYASLSI